MLTFKKQCDPRTRPGGTCGGQVLLTPGKPSSVSPNVVLERNSNLTLEYCAAGAIKSIAPNGLPVTVISLELEAAMDAGAGADSLNRENQREQSCALA
ncbi:hypothetical protein [Polaromonas aquatica]|uniref:hypothetical protein n=1 Tax=Polaromonas aquatica TaxID=332657 RepID=UPI003D646B5B